MEFSLILLERLFFFSNVGVHIVSKRLMKSHWRFLRPGQCQSLHGSSAAGTATPDIPPLSHIQRSAHLFPVEHYLLKQVLMTWNRSDQLLSVGHYTQQGSQWRIYPSPCFLWEAAMTSLSIMPRWLHSGYIQPLENINQVIFTIIPPAVVVLSTQFYACLRYMKVKSEKSILNFSLLFIGIIFPL